MMLQQCKSITLIVCAMLLQEYEGRIAALGMRLEEQQKDKAAAAEVSDVQVALLPAGASSNDHGPCHHQEYACIMSVITTTD